MAQLDNSLLGLKLGLMQSPDFRRYAPLSGESNYPAGARPSNCIVIIPVATSTAETLRYRNPDRAPQAGFYVILKKFPIDTK
jgi:hypothetical protein